MEKEGVSVEAAAVAGAVTGNLSNKLWKFSCFFIMHLLL